LHPGLGKRYFPVLLLASTFGLPPEPPPVPPARAAREKLRLNSAITLAKRDNLAGRRLAFNRLRDRDSVTKLFGELGARYRERPGGYLRILKCGFRAGDKATMAIVELVDRPPADADEPPAEA